MTSGVDTTRIMAASRTLAQVTNTPAPRNKPIVGANAFAHEAGIHQHGILQNRETYEIMKPEDIGLATDGIVLGRHSGRHALAARAKELGYVLEGAKLDRAFAAFRAQADEVGIVDAARLLALLAELETGRPQRLWKLSKVDIRAPVSDRAWPVARVELDHGERGRVTDIASAPGALDAAFAAVSQMIRIPARVETLEMQYLADDPDEEGDDKQGANVLVEMTIDVEGEIFAGRARARDILPCCVSAFIDAASNAEAVRAMRGDAARRDPRRLQREEATCPISSCCPATGSARSHRRGGRNACALSRRVRVSTSCSRRTPIGGAAIDAQATRCRRRRWPPAARADAILLGAVGGPNGTTRAPRCAPKQGLLALRKALGLYANLRPVRVDRRDGATPRRCSPRSLDRRRPDGRARADRRHLLRRQERDERRRLRHLRLHAAPRSSGSSAASRFARGRGARSSPRSTRPTCSRRRGCGARSSRESRRSIPTSRSSTSLVDACGDAPRPHPRDFDVIVTENMFGDILSDEVVDAGRLDRPAPVGLAGRRQALAFTSRSTARRPTSPAGTSPIPPARSLSAAMLLDLALDLPEEARLLNRALESALRRGLPHRRSRRRPWLRRVRRAGARDPRDPAGPPRGDRRTGDDEPGLLRVSGAPRTLYEKIWDAHVVERRDDGTCLHLYRPPPRPRSDQPAGVRGAAAWPAARSAGPT